MIPTKSVQSPQAVKAKPTRPPRPTSINEDGARAANTQLKAWGYETWLVKESESGEYSNYWHIAAAKPQLLRANVVARTRVTMERLAERHGGQYACWEVSHRSPKLSDRRIRSLLQQMRASRERAVGNTAG